MARIPANLPLLNISLRIETPPPMSPQDFLKVWETLHSSSNPSSPMHGAVNFFDDLLMLAPQTPTTINFSNPSLMTSTSTIDLSGPCATEDASDAADEESDECYSPSLLLDMLQDDGRKKVEVIEKFEACDLCSFFSDLDCLDGVIIC